MKYLLLLFFVGCTTASFYDALVEKDVVQKGIEVLESMADDTEEDIKVEVEQKLREAFEKVLQKMLDALSKGEEVKEELFEKAKELREKLRNLKVDLGNKARELMKKVKDRARELLRELLEKMGLNKRSTGEAHMEINIKKMFKKLKDEVLANISREKLKAKVEEIFGKGNEIADSLLEIINKHLDKYKQKVLDFIDRHLGKEPVEKRSLKELWDKVKDYFKNLNIEIKEKYAKFGEWVKDVLDKGLTKSKDKMENIRNIAREFLEHTKGMSKEVAVEALEFMKPYKEDLGALWDQLKETVKDIINKRD